MYRVCGNNYLIRRRKKMKERIMLTEQDKIRLYGNNLFQVISAGEYSLPVGYRAQYDRILSCIVERYTIDVKKAVTPFLPTRAIYPELEPAPPVTIESASRKVLYKLSRYAKYTSFEKALTKLERLADANYDPDKMATTYTLKENGTLARIGRPKEGLRTDNKHTSTKTRRSVRVRVNLAQYMTDDEMTSIADTRSSERKALKERIDTILDCLPKKTGDRLKDIANSIVRSDGTIESSLYTASNRKFMERVTDLIQTKLDMTNKPDARALIMSVYLVA